MIARKTRMLLVDDEPDLLALMQIALQRQGYEVEVCRNAENLDLIIEENPPDIILLDIKMDNVNGSDVCKTIKSNPTTKHIKVILFSSNDNLKLVANDCGADGSLSKPYDMKLAYQMFADILK